MENEQMKPLVVLIVIFLIAGVVGTFLFMDMMERFTGGDPYTQDNDYSVTGTYFDGTNTFEVAGDAYSKTAVESDNDHIYSFRFELRYNGTGTTLKTALMCDREGVPLSMFTHLGDLGDGLSLWSYTENGYTYTYKVGDHCRVSEVLIAGNGFDLGSTITG